VVGRGVLVVKLWWIAGESWEVDGSVFGLEKLATSSGFIFEDSHFGNSALKTTPMVGKVTGMNLVDETSERGPIGPRLLGESCPP